MAPTRSCRWSLGTRAWPEPVPGSETCSFDGRVRLIDVPGSEQVPGLETLSVGTTAPLRQLLGVIRLLSIGTGLRRVVPYSDCC